MVYYSEGRQLSSAWGRAPGVGPGSPTHREPWLSSRVESCGTDPPDSDVRWWRGVLHPSLGLEFLSGLCHIDTSWLPTADLHLQSLCRSSQCQVTKALTINHVVRLCGAAPSQKMLEELRGDLPAAEGKGQPPLWARLNSLLYRINIPYPSFCMHLLDDIMH